MEIEIKKAEEKYLKDCIDALLNSELGRQYFSKNKAIRAITSGIGKEEIYVAINEADECVGFIWGVRYGAFNIFPYLHIVAVKEDHRGKGIGKKLIDYCANVIFEDEDKIFLVVADYNPDAKRLYEKLGYSEVGKIPSLYKKGVDEYLMMKVKEDVEE